MTRDGVRLGETLAGTLQFEWVRSKQWSSWRAVGALEHGAWSLEDWSLVDKPGAGVMQVIRKHLMLLRRYY